MNHNADRRDFIPRNTILVWDFPVRLGHWIGVACFLTLWFTRQAHLLDLHAAAGYALLAVAVFRICWGFVGTRHARFANFAFSPRAVVNYLRAAISDSAEHFAGHNPAGSWSVYLLLALIVCATLSGVLALGGMFALGPAANALGPPQGETARAVHEFLAWSLLVLVAMHLAGVAWSSRVHAENLVGAMITGRKPAWKPSDGIASSRLATGAAVAVIVAVGAGAYVIQSGWPQDYAVLRAAAKDAAQRAPPTIWSKECDSCHFPYPPDFLVTQSNAELLARQAEHFGEDLGLDNARIAELSRFANGHAAPRTWATWKLQQGSRSGMEALRVTQSPLWREKHASLEESFKTAGFPKAHACEACHGDAVSGMFSPRLIHIPEQQNGQ